VDKVWEREKLKAAQKAKKRADSHLSGARCVGRLSWLCLQIDKKACSQNLLHPLQYLELYFVGHY
jgi:hypothetical protein